MLYGWKNKQKTKQNNTINKKTERLLKAALEGGSIVSFSGAMFLLSGKVVAAWDYPVVSIRRQMFWR